MKKETKKEVTGKEKKLELEILILKASGFDAYQKIEYAQQLIQSSQKSIQSINQKLYEIDSEEKIEE